MAGRAPCQRMAKESVPKRVGASCTSTPWPYQEVGIIDASASPSVVSWTSMVRPQLSSSAAAQQWCTAPMHRPATQRWKASGQVQVHEAAERNHSSWSSDSRSPEITPTNHTYGGGAGPH